jgi:hypothetical protein
MHSRLRCHGKAAVEQGRALAGAWRRQDRGDFETWNQLDRLLDLRVRRR